MKTTEWPVKKKEKRVWCPRSQERERGVITRGMRLGDAQ